MTEADRCGASWRHWLIEGVALRIPDYRVLEVLHTIQPIPLANLLGFADEAEDQIAPQLTDGGRPWPVRTAMPPERALRSCP